MLNESDLVWGNPSAVSPVRQSRLFLRAKRHFQTESNPDLRPNPYLQFDQLEDQAHRKPLAGTPQDIDFLVRFCATDDVKSSIKRLSMQYIWTWITCA